MIKKNIKFYLLLITDFIKADLYLSISDSKPNDIDLLPPYFCENQELTLDMCRYKLFSQHQKENSRLYLQMMF